MRGCMCKLRGALWFRVAAMLHECLSLLQDVTCARYRCVFSHSIDNPANNICSSHTVVIVCFNYFFCLFDTVDVNVRRLDVVSPPFSSFLVFRGVVLLKSCVQTWCDLCWTRQV